VRPPVICRAFSRSRLHRDRGLHAFCNQDAWFCLVLDGPDWGSLSFVVIGAVGGVTAPNA
jgi:hypothetical protein